MITKHVIKICKGPACSQRFANDIRRAAEEATGEDETIEIRTCGCRGFCEDGPTVVVDDVVHSHMSEVAIVGIITGIKKEKIT
ncbi:MAG: (2Fe-2S) ferredoxin domain-containing protein [bacterium]